jgi:hypothetical protein
MGVIVVVAGAERRHHVVFSPMCLAVIAGLRLALASASRRPMGYPRVCDDATSCAARLIRDKTLVHPRGFKGIGKLIGRGLVIVDEDVLRRNAKP